MHPSEARTHPLPAGLRLSTHQQVWLAAEQQHVHRRVDTRHLDAGSVASIDSRFLPERRGCFELPTFWVPRQVAEVLSTSPSEESRWQRLLSRDRAVLFFVHPAALAAAPRLITQAPRGPRCVATPTASTRTVWAQLEGAPTAFMVKLALPFEFAGEFRGFDRDSAIRSVVHTWWLSQHHRWQGALPILREPWAVSLTGASAFGFAIRSPPQPNTRILPFFALTHPGRDGTPPMVTRWWPAPVRAERIRAQLLRPLLRQVCRAAVDGAWVAALHAQNLLITLNDRGALSGFLVRDLDDVAVDWHQVQTRWPRLAWPDALRPFARHPALGATEQESALRHTLHAHFVGGPLTALAPFLGGRRAARAMFDETLAEVLAAPAADGREFQQRIEARRDAALRPPRPPRQVRTWLEREQILNQRVRDPRFFARVDDDRLGPRFDASAQPIFRLEAVPVPTAAVQTRGVPGQPVRVSSNRRTRHLPFHPFMREALGIDLTQRPAVDTGLWATPTSSPRTLVCWSSSRGPAWCLKLPLDLELLNISRVLKRSKLERAVGVSRLLSQIRPERLRAFGVSFMREPGSAWVDDGGEAPAVALITRELPPGMNAWWPGFSVFAPNGDDPPELLRLAGTRHASRLVDTIEQRLWAPLTRAAAFLMLDQGVIPDLHQQNVLLRFDARADTQVLVRDLDAFKTDLTLRRLRGLPMSAFDDLTGSTDDLKLGGHDDFYDVAFIETLRADWLYLAHRFLRAHGQGVTRAHHLELRARFDRCFLREAQRHLPDSVMRSELRYALSRHRSTRRWLSRLELSRLTLPEVLACWPARVWADEGLRGAPRFSVNALVKALKAQLASAGSV